MQVIHNKHSNVNATNKRDILVIGNSERKQGFYPKDVGALKRAVCSL